ncbi:hypothetical protein LY78DRAFT_450184 [Colletotrichum sublineola]|nr:hypothetical protein LY78DRAFT_450184 [Colletotrichum sublineola]
MWCLVKSVNFRRCVCSCARAGAGMSCCLCVCLCVCVRPDASFHTCALNHWRQCEKIDKEVVQGRAGQDGGIVNRCGRRFDDADDRVGLIWEADSASSYLAYTQSVKPPTSTSAPGRNKKHGRCTHGGGCRRWSPERLEQDK